MFSPTRLVVAIVAVLVVAGCGSSTGGDPGPPAPGPTAVAAAQGGSAFDPCADIDDQVVREVGFNPATREPKPPVGEYTAACQFGSADMSLVVSTSNTTFEE